ncbi:MAG: hypothetical protein JO045_05345 [Mycobacterium sp.]|nr:hypothetical protein [Mycobacterium sp.]
MVLLLTERNRTWTVEILERWYRDAKRIALRSLLGGLVVEMADPAGETVTLAVGYTPQRCA